HDLPYPFFVVILTTTRRHCAHMTPWPIFPPLILAYFVTGGNNGVLLFDDTGFGKQGTASVGVARQYSGTLGTGGNCQVAVTCGYSDPQASWPVAVRVSLPQEWTDAPERWRRARVPADVSCQTKPQRALALLDQARAWGVPHRCVVAEADYGDNPHCLAGLETRNARYVVAVLS